MRLLRLIRSVNVVWGGPIEVLLQTNRLLVERGWEIDVCSLDGKKSDEGARFPGILHSFDSVAKGYGYSKELVPWIKKNLTRFDAVIVDGIWQYHSFAVWRALRKSKVPYFVYTHGMLDPWFKRTYPLKHLKKWLYWPWADYRVLRDAAAVLFTCKEEARLAKQSFWLHRWNGKVVPFGTNPPPERTKAQLNEFQETFPHLKSKRLLLFLGRLHVKKGPDLLLNAFAEVLKHGTIDSEIQLVMAGPDDQPYASDLKRLAVNLGIGDRITWTGMLSGEVKWGALRQADAFILPSHQENFGIAVAEALACGTPVLISNQVNIWREIDEAGAGYVEADSLEGTRKLIDRWLNTSRQECEKIRVAAKSCFDAKFDLTNCVVELEREIKERLKS